MALELLSLTLSVLHVLSYIQKQHRVQLYKHTLGGKAEQNRNFDII